MTDEPIIAKEEATKFPSMEMQIFIVLVKVNVIDPKDPQVIKDVEIRQYTIIAPGEDFVKDQVLKYLGGEIISMQRQACFVLRTK